ncbi:MAG: hypothetical protein ACLS2V_15450 [Clostridium paraputrificum]|uniref:hypothetical protein n=1 Tax=Clostridium TaxID=1485 RepID=UPI001897F64F|nr:MULTISPECIES: hypothetical protein [Clostridium]MDB2084942.1 hypothetical protein [Clostridium paraputrificum]MDB2109348.1 hypothetical protein [Clostridium paraputrificum]MDU5741695.1 hypothetical protein [Clostridium sp.]MDU5785996.1 hypothetical protein [Clostridium sp.]
MSELFEVFMVLCFGVSWPISIYKSIKSKTAKGKSLLFIFMIWIGYVFGILSKVLSGSINYVLFFYVLNITIVSIDIIVFFRNSKLDRERQLRGVNI